MSGYSSPQQSGPSAKAAQRQFLVSISSETGTAASGQSNNLPTVSTKVLNGYWANKSGGESQTTITKVYDGGNPYPFNIPSVYAVNDLTLSRPYDISTDPNMVGALRPLVGRWYVKIKVVPTDADYNAFSPAETYHGVLSGVTPPTVDSSSGAAATLTLTFSIAWVG